MEDSLGKLNDSNGNAKNNGSFVSAKQLRKAEKRKEKEKRKESKETKGEAPIEVRSMKEFSDEVEFSRVKEFLLRKHYNVNGNNSIKNGNTPNARIPLTAGYGIAGSGYGDALGSDDENNKVEQHYSDLYSPINYDEKYFEHAKKWEDSKYQTHPPLTQLWQTIRSATKDSKNTWMSKFLNSVAEGRIQQVTAGITHIEKVLRNRKVNNNQYMMMDRNELLSIIAKVIVDKLSDDRVGNNIIMLLSSGCFGPKACHEREHSVCSTLHLLLAALTKKERRRVLSIRSKLEGYLPLHFAAMFGQPCQLAVLLNFGANPNVYDNYEHLPCFYVLQRNNVMMIRQLLWAGADLSTMTTETLQPYKRDMDCLEVDEWLRIRLASMNEAIYGWTSYSLKQLFKINRKISRLYQMRVNGDGDDTAQMGRRIEAGKMRSVDEPNCFNRRFQLIIDDDFNPSQLTTNDVLILMIIPVQWTHLEAYTPPDFPHLTRIGTYEIDEKTPISLFALPPEIFDGLGSPKTLKSLLSPTDNGHFYLYMLPSGLSNDQNSIINFTISTLHLGERSRHWRLLIQMRGSGRRRSSDCDLNSPIARRRRMDGNSASTRNAGMERLSKEEQEQRDAQMARELQREEEEMLIRQQERVIEPTLSPGILSLILRDSPSTNRSPARHRHGRRRSSSQESVEITEIRERPLPRRRGSTRNRTGNDGTSANNRNNLRSNNDSDMYDGELTPGDGSEVSSEDSDSSDASDDTDEEIMSVDTSEASGDEHDTDLEDSTNDEESDGDDSDSSTSSHLSAPGDLGVLGHDFFLAAHRMLGMAHQVNLILANEDREHRSSTPPEDPPDETVIQCSDWGQCTICFEEAPYDPVGCLHCLQLIGCKICVTRWFRGGRPRADSPLGLGQSGSNHRQCPLCRHEYQAEFPEVGSMFELAPKN